MKRALLAAILGIATSVVNTYGQGAVFFDTYISTGYFPVKWGGPAGPAVLPADGVFANLLWTYGSTSGNANLAIPTSGDPGSYGPGFIHGPIVTTAADYAGGPITFTIQVWSGGTGYGAPGNIATGTLTWTETAGIPFGGAPADTFGSLPGPIIIGAVVPEPSALALAGLASVAFLISRRRK